MKSVNKFMKFFFICYVVTLAQGCKGEMMDVHIKLSIEDPAEPLHLLDKTPIYPMGFNLTLKTSFTNNSSTDINIEDPNTCQKYFLKMKSDDGFEDNYFLINPSKVDVTGEVTAPIPKSVNIKPEEFTTHSFELFGIIPDKCFSPGYYTLYIEFDDVKSEVLSFGVEYRPESVSKLSDILINENADSWLRDVSLEWLEKLPKPLEIILPDSEETEKDKSERIKQNNKSMKLFQHQWHYDESTDETKLFFEQFRLKPEVVGE